MDDEPIPQEITLEDTYKTAVQAFAAVSRLITVLLEKGLLSVEEADDIFNLSEDVALNTMNRLPEFPSLIDRQNPEDDLEP